MVPNEKYLANCVIIIVVTWANVAMIFDREDFPFAPYTMYSYPYRAINRIEYKTVFVDQEGKEEEVSYIHPWDEARLNMHLQRVFDKQGPIKTTLVLQDVFKTYYANKKKKNHNFIGLKFYRYKWNKFTSKNYLQPTSKKVLAQYLERN